MLLEEPIDHTCAAGGRRKEEGREGEAVMRGKSGGGRGREVSHEFTAWLNIVNYWLARAMTDSYSRAKRGHSMDGQAHDFSITFRLITRGI